MAAAAAAAAAAAECVRVLWSFVICDRGKRRVRRLEEAPLAVNASPHLFHVSVHACIQPIYSIETTGDGDDDRNGTLDGPWQEGEVLNDNDRQDLVGVQWVGYAPAVVPRVFMEERLGGAGETGGSTGIPHRALLYSWFCGERS